MDETNINELNALGDIDFDQTVDSDSVVATDGGVAANGTIDESAINTGINTGVMAADDADLSDSILGDGNFQINDGQLGAVAIGGDATNAGGENVNLGSGTLVDTSAGGDAQVTAGDGNGVMGDVDIAVGGVDGPFNLAVGDDNAQQAQEDNSSTISDSFNTDQSNNDSFNTSVADSFNAVHEDNDTISSTISDSGNFASEDNDTNILSADFETNFSSIVEDNDTQQFLNDTDLEEINVLGDGNDVDLDN